MNLHAFVPWSLFLSLNSPVLIDGNILHIRIGHPCTQRGAEFSVKLAKSEVARAKGLSGTRKLARGEGMLFFFEPPVPVRFWMKDTLIPLEIAFFRHDASLIRSENMGVEQDPKRPVKTYSSVESTQLVLETNPEEMRLTKGQPAELCVEKSTSR